MNFIMQKDLQEAFKGALADLSHFDTTIVQVESVDAERRMRSLFAGLDEVLKIAPEGKPVVMISVAGEKSILVNNLKWQACMGYPNVSFAQLPTSLSNIKKAIEEAQNPTRPKDELAISMAGVSLDQRDLGILKHDLYHFDSFDEERKNKWINMAKGLYGDLTIEELKESVSSSAKPNQSRFKDQRLKGVFVDVEGTLLQNGEINQELLAQLQEMSKEKPITIWTDADIKEVSRPLRAAGIIWKILPKELFSGATAEEVYDDLSQEEFEEKYGIKTEVYHQIKPKEEIREGNPNSPANI